MRVRAEVRGDLAALIQDETDATARALRDGIDRAGLALQADLRDQTKRALPRGQGIANAWRERVYPVNPFVRTLHPTALVWSRTPDIISAFDEGKPITVKRTKFLCWPTGYNAAGGRRNASGRGGVRVSTDEMTAAKGQSVVIPTRRRGTYLWCLRVRQASSRGGRTGRGRGRVQLYVGGKNVQVNTGRGKAGERQERQTQLVALGLVPMFILQRSVNPGKRLDVAGAAAKADAALPGYLAVELGRQ